MEQKILQEKEDLLNQNMQSEGREMLNHYLFVDKKNGPQLESIIISMIRAKEIQHVSND